MRLFIAEKPSLARAIADALPGPAQRRDGYFQCGPGDQVAWCAGHILEPAPPDAYDPKFKQWRIEHLPIAPDEWKLAVSAPDLLKTIKVLLARAARVVHAGDPDREGQLLVDEVLAFLGYRGAVDRLLISDLNQSAVRKALTDLKSNDRYRGLYEAAVARQRADWLYGINLTRLYTLLGRAGGYDGILSVGRVQTPLLGLIVRRDLEIECFEARTYYAVRAEIRCASGRFTAIWQPPKDAAGIVDNAGRLVARELALAIRTKTVGLSGLVAHCSREKKSEAPPLPYSLPDIQIDAGKHLGLTPKQTLDACQALYETHRLLTYPRSDCTYLPEGQHDQSVAVLGAIATNLPSLRAATGSADRSRRSRAWNDQKITAHHAIVPTLVTKSLAALSAAERGVYELVACRYVAQFYPPFEYHETKLEIVVEGERFRASGRQPSSEGWRALVARVPDDEEIQHTDQDGSTGALPMLEEGQQITCREVTIAEKHTTPPKRFTDAMLIEAMIGIARYVQDPKIKQLLRETDGIGTPATQAAIIQTLFDRRFIERRGRQVMSTPIGRALIQSLPEVAVRPDMTALWEAAIRRIAEGQMPLAQFLSGVLEQLRKLVDAGRTLGRLSEPAVSPGSGRSSARTNRRRRRDATGRRSALGQRSPGESG